MGPPSPSSSPSALTPPTGAWIASHTSSSWDEAPPQALPLPRPESSAPRKPPTPAHGTESPAPRKSPLPRPAPLTPGPEPQFPPDSFPRPRPQFPRPEPFQASDPEDVDTIPSMPAASPEPPYAAHPEPSRTEHSERSRTEHAGRSKRSGSADRPDPAPRSRRSSRTSRVEPEAIEWPRAAEPRVDEPVEPRTDETRTDEIRTDELVAPRPVAHTPLGMIGRTGVLVVLAAVTVLAPLGTRVGFLSLAVTPAVAAQTGTTTTDASVPVSVADAVLGSDADVDENSDTEMSNVPDAATLARIRAAHDNATVTCASKSSGASGDTSAFVSAPEVFNPMMEGTYEISSPWGYRMHPTLGILKLHAGQDYAAPAGTPIYAAAAGEVVTAGMVDGTGTVTIKHDIDGQVWYTSYLHMYEDGIYVHVGDKVTAGQLIAAVGSTGRSTGAHLHFEVRTANDDADESTVDPMTWLTEHHAVELTTDCS